MGAAEQAAAVLIGSWEAGLSPGAARELRDVPCHCSGWAWPPTRPAAPHSWWRAAQCTAAQHPPTSPQQSTPQPSLGLGQDPLTEQQQEPPRCISVAHWVTGPGRCPASPAGLLLLPMRGELQLTAPSCSGPCSAAPGPSPVRLLCWSEVTDPWCQAGSSPQQRQAPEPVPWDPLLPWDLWGRPRPGSSQKQAAGWLESSLPLSLKSSHTEVSARWGGVACLLERSCRWPRLA